MKKSAPLLLAMAVVAATGCRWNHDAVDSSEAGGLLRVASVVDGDTIEARIRGEEERVRLIGVDAPESVHPSGRIECFAEASATFTRRHLEGRRIRLEFDVQRRDRFGRLLAYVYIGRTLFNRTLVAEGYAFEKAYPPNTRHQPTLRLAEIEARRLERGLWKACGR